MEVISANFLFCISLIEIKFCNVYTKITTIFKIHDKTIAGWLFFIGQLAIKNKNNGLHP